MNRYSKSFCVLGWAILILFHFYRISAIPGLHYDEAWAFNFSWRIASERGFWPFAAMSPYTSPWAHYWAALWLGLWGPSVAIFRGSQITLALAGLFFLALALPERARAIFPWVCLFLPGLVLNHRFAIELTGFNVLCFGVLCWSLCFEEWSLACVAALAGTTSHILFYAVPLGLLGAVCLNGVVLSKRSRLAAFLYFAIIGFFFLRVFFLIPEKTKAAALVLSAFSACGLLAANGERWGIWRSPWWKRGVAAGALVFSLCALFFSSGIWTAGLYSGVAMGSAILILCWIYWSGLYFRHLTSQDAFLRSAILLTTLFLGLMMLKPAPRYFEIVFLAYAALLALWGAGQWRLAMLPAVPLYFLIGSMVFGLGSVESRTVLDVSPHFLLFKDSSRDFLDKQSLVRFLGGSGCGRSDIQTHDPRLKEELDALSLGDWPVKQASCPYIYVALRTEEGATGEPHGEFLLKKR